MDFKVFDTDGNIVAPTSVGPDGYYIEYTCPPDKESVTLVHGQHTITLSRGDRIILNERPRDE